MQKVLRDHGREMNQSQLAVALWLAAGRIEYNQVAVSVPAGLGKTRILLGLACLLKRLKWDRELRFKRIVIAYPNQELLNQELHNLKAIKEVCNCLEWRVAKSEMDLTFDGRTVTALILEEADWMLLDMQWKPKASFVVALTATA